MMFLVILKFFIYTLLIVIISKYVLVKHLRGLAENLNLKPETVGEVAGYATSIPEFLTTTTSCFSGLLNASVYNILSSNIINLIQYILAIIKNKNIKHLYHTAIKTDLILVILTIIIPLFLIYMNIQVNISIIPIYILLFMLFRFINNNVHKLYLKNEDRILESELEKEAKWERNNKKKARIHIIILVLSGIFLYFVGDKLGIVLETLCNNFGISEFYIGILLGFFTSIPELITFFESQKHYKNKNHSLPGVVEATNNLLSSNVLNLFIIESFGILIFTF